MSTCTAWDALWPSGYTRTHFPRARGCGTSRGNTIRHFSTDAVRNYHVAAESVGVDVHTLDPESQEDEELEVRLSYNTQ